MKKHVELLCISVSLVFHKYLQTILWDYIWNFTSIFVLKQHTALLHGLSSIVCETGWNYFDFLSRLFCFLFQEFLLSFLCIRILDKLFLSFSWNPWQEISGFVSEILLNFLWISMHVFWCFGDLLMIFLRASLKFVLNFLWILINFLWISHEIW